MTNAAHDTPFQYEDALVAACAASPLSQSVGHRPGETRARERGRPTPTTLPPPGACRVLFERHAAHYQRPPLSTEEERLWAAVANSTAEGGSWSEPLTPRIEAFLRSVLFVQRHNALGTHEVALNRFSDLSLHELPLMPPSATGGATSPFGAASAEFEPAEAARAALLPQYPPSLFQREEAARAETPTFVALESEQHIYDLGAKLRLKEQQLLLRNLEMGGQSWWWVGGGYARDPSGAHDDPRQHYSKKQLKKHAKKKKHAGGTELLDIAQASGLAGKKDQVRGQKDDWNGYLNWATEDNPDGVPIVHDAIDQGSCGSCWAISALGTLEASVARNMAYVAYKEALSSAATTSLRMFPQSKSTDARQYAVLAAQLIEQQSIDLADLSVQELIDCDTRYNQGCAGGNPLLASYFLHRVGVTAKKSYPYMARRGTCSYPKVDEPIATVETWGVLTPDHEDNMEKVLRFIGPVAVGLIGADPGFLSYKKGVFRSTKGGKCDFSQADHAMLITGYGEEKRKHGHVQKYWIARNSWGSGWGENGYIKIARSGGKKGERGECGIARSPSIALGGSFTKEVNLGNKLYGSTRSGLGPSGGGVHTGDSFTARASTQIKSGLHQIRTRLGFIELGIKISTNSGNANRDMDMLLPYLLVIGMLAFCLLLAQTQWKRRRREVRCPGDQQPAIIRCNSTADESVATNWSTIVLYNGDHENAASRNSATVTIGFNDGERRPLLEHSSGARYT